MDLQCWAKRRRQDLMFYKSTNVGKAAEALEGCRSPKREGIFRSTKQRLERNARNSDNAARAALDCDAVRHVKTAEHRAPISAATAVLHFTEILPIGQKCIKVRAGIGTAAADEKLHIARRHRVFAF